MKKVISCVLLFAFTTTHANIPEIIAPEKKEKTFYEAMRDENTKSLLHTEKYDGWNCNTTKEYCALLKKQLISDQNPTAIHKRRRSFEFFTKYEESNPKEKNTTIDSTTQKDLELLCGPKSYPECYISEKINRTSTEIGTLTLFKKIIQPHTNIESLLKEQKLIQTLLANKNLFETFDNQLKELTISETLLLESRNTHDMYKGQLSHGFKITIPFAKKLSKYLSTNESILEFDQKNLLFFDVVHSTAIITAATLIPLMLFIKYSGLKKTSLGQSINSIEKKFKKDKFLTASAMGLTFGMLRKLNLPISHASENIMVRIFSAKRIPRIFDNFLFSFTIYKCLQDKLIFIAKYFNNMQTIASELEKHPKVTQYSSALRTFPLQLKKLHHANKDLKHFLKLLKTNTFKGKSQYLSHSGRSIAAYRLLIGLEEAITPLIVSIGELDAYMSIARLCKEYEEKNIPFCFPEYIDPKTQDHPCINIKNFWYPVIAPEKAVPNSLTLGTQYNKPQNIIVTGPNAGGKSTTVKGLAINLILAQSLGIATAESLTFTPFEKITTYLNITDDIAAGNSHFKAGVVRARDVIETTNSLKQGQFGFTALDEVFNGTTFKEGQAAAYSLIKKIGMHPNNMCATCTHFPIITSLASDTNAFANYKVSIEETRGKICYPYKLEEGISDQIITFKILEEEGFGDEFLEEAQRMLKKYS
jgi:DNA mismatch repair protein MutS